MPKTWFWIILFAGCALCWWPAMIEPSIDFPRWLVLVDLGVCVAAGNLLADGRWAAMAWVAVAGSAVGLISGYALWPPEDAIARSYFLIVTAVVLLLVLALSLLTGLSVHAVRKLWPAPVERSRRLIGAALVFAGAAGPLVLAATPLWVARRVAHNDQMAAARFASLRSAIVKTLAEPGGAERICDGRALRRNYAGPPFSETNWRYVSGNYVQQDGYVFGVNCHARKGFALDARPKRTKGDGTRTFCADASGVVDCGVYWDGPAYGCVTCQP